jgi:hypothetical protein
MFAYDFFCYIFCFVFRFILFHVLRPLRMTNSSIYIHAPKGVFVNWINLKNRHSLYVVGKRIFLQFYLLYLERILINDRHFSGEKRLHLLKGPWEEPHDGTSLPRVFLVHQCFSFFTKREARSIFVTYTGQWIPKYSKLMSPIKTPNYKVHQII